jgi:serine phosphatase RsbU (regulator of sigma subunit)
MKLRALLGASPQATAFIATLNTRSLATLTLAVFTLFAIMGFLTDIASGGRQPWPLLITNVLFSGTIAIGYGVTGIIASGLRGRGTALGRVWVPRAWGIAGIAAVFAVHMAYSATVGEWFDRAGEVPAHLRGARLRFDAGGIALCVAISYALFLSFINGTGSRLVEARAELRLAAEIHAVLVPAIARRVGSFDFYGLSKASGDVGGDLVDLVLARRDEAGRATGTAWIGYVADVSGHGVSSGLLMGMAKSAAHMKLRADPSLAALLTDLNAVLFHLKRPSMYITFAGMAWRGDDDLEVIVAGHLPILRVTVAGDVTEITTPQLPLGFFEETTFVSARLRCAPGDLLVLVTDGLTEVFDPQDREFGLDRVKAYLAAHSREPLAAIAAGLVSLVRAHGPQLDDQTLLLVRRDVVSRSP